jgi:hypothetical protein
LILSAVLAVALCSCSKPQQIAPAPSVEIPMSGQSRAIIGDGLELRCFRITASIEELQRIMLAIGGELVSSEDLVLGGFELYELPRDRIDDFTSVVSDGRAWNTRWLGQQFDWTNLLPGVAPYVDGEFNGWIALPCRSWSTMMEDGPVVVLEAVPVVGTRQIGWGGERPMERFRLEQVLRPDTALVLFGGSGMPLEHEISVVDQSEFLESTGLSVGQQLLMSTAQIGSDPSEMQPRAAGTALVLLPQFTSGRRMPPPPGPR